MPAAKIEIIENMKSKNPFALKYCLYPRPIVSSGSLGSFTSSSSAIS